MVDDGLKIGDAKADSTEPEGVLEVVEEAVKDALDPPPKVDIEDEKIII